MGGPFRSTVVYLQTGNEDGGRFPESRIPMRFYLWVVETMKLRASLFSPCAGRLRDTNGEGSAWRKRVGVAGAFVCRREGSAVL